MNRTLLALFILLVYGCATTEKKGSAVYFAGEIVNPTSDYVVLYKGDMPIDSARLDEKNRFQISLDTIDEGLHHFYHSPELQYVFFENGDSLQIRLNTYYFDESLMFSGEGEEVNNFLVEMFLANEAEEELVYSYYSMEPKDFCKKVDSLSKRKMDQLLELQEESPMSEEAFELAKASILYNTYIHKEPYPYYHKKKKGEKSIHELPSDFYAYHKEVDFDNVELTYLRPYYNFMKYHMGNLSYLSCKQKCMTPDGKMVHNNLHFNTHQLRMIDSLIEQEELRDNLFRNVAFNYLLKHDSEANTKAFIEEFHKLSGNNKHIEEINNLHKDILNLQPNKDMPELYVKNTSGESVSLKELSKDKEIVLYFWSAVEKSHFKNIMQRVETLEQEYPNYTFVGINLRTDENRWRAMLEEYKLDTSQQYWADDYKEFAHTLVVYYPNKSIIAKDGKIVDAFANVYSSFK